VLYLKARRLLRGSSTRDVRDGTGINISILSQIETNRVNPRPDELATLAKYFHVDAALLMTHIDERTLVGHQVAVSGYVKVEDTKGTDKVEDLPDMVVIGWHNVNDHCTSQKKGRRKRS